MADQQPFVEAAKEYAWLRRSFWRFLLGGVVSFVALGLPLLIADKRLDPLVRSVLGAAVVGTSVVCWIGAVSMWMVLLNWRCPQCGRRFILH